MIDDRVYLESHISGLKEDELWDLLKKFFKYHLKLDTYHRHSPSEHGMDLVVKVDRGRDLLGTGYVVVIQAKAGKLRLGDWRKVLAQLLEAPYFRIPRPQVFDQCLARRLLLVISGSPTPEAQEGIDEFNKKHDFKVEVWEIEKIIDEFDRWDFDSWLMTEIEKVGVGGAPQEPGPSLGEPPEAGVPAKDETPSTSDIVGAKDPNT
jgi:hypothetical protein